jgi:hypothetical protein
MSGPAASLENYQPGKCQGLLTEIASEKQDAEATLLLNADLPDLADKCGSQDEADEEPPSDEEQDSTEDEDDGFSSDGGETTTDEGEEKTDTAEQKTTDEEDSGFSSDGGETTTEKADSGFSSDDGETRPADQVRRRPEQRPPETRPSRSGPSGGTLASSDPLAGEWTRISNSSYHGLKCTDANQKLTSMKNLKYWTFKPNNMNSLNAFRKRMTLKFFGTNGRITAKRAFSNDMWRYDGPFSNATKIISRVGNELIRLKKVGKRKYQGEYLHFAHTTPGMGVKWWPCTMRVHKNIACVKVTRLYYNSNCELFFFLRFTGGAPDFNVDWEWLISQTAGRPSSGAATGRRGAPAGGSGPRSDKCYVGCIPGSNPLRCAAICDGNDGTAIYKLTVQGYSNIRLGPTTWDNCVKKMRRLRQPGW